MASIRSAAGSDGFERGASQVRAWSSAGEAEMVPRARSPSAARPGRQRGQRRHAALVGHGPRQRLDLVRADDPQPVAKPLHRRTGDEDAALQREGRLAARFPGDRGEQPSGWRGGAPPVLTQHEGAGAVRALRHRPARSRPAEQRGLLVARDARDGHAVGSVEPLVVTPQKRCRAAPRGSTDAARARGAQVASHAASRILKSSVREALVTSVTCTLRRRRDSRRSQLSTVPKASSPRSAARARRRRVRGSTRPWCRRSTGRARGPVVRGTAARVRRA